MTIFEDTDSFEQASIAAKADMAETLQECRETEQEDLLVVECL